MSYKKILVIITIFVMVMIALMLSSSYAWYSFENASTEFEVVTNNEDISITYHTGRYISTSIAVPIGSGDIEQYSEKSSFSIDVKNAALENEIVVTIDLVDVVIDEELKNSNFRYDLLLDGEVVSSGDFSGVSDDTFNLSQAVVLDALNTNDFEVRIYILDDGTNQNNMMNKTFKGTISINVISKLSTTINQSGADILINNIIIDGKESDYLPVNGYYDMTSTCSKGSVLSWNPLSKTITYDKGSKISDNCSLVFVSSTNYPKLVDVAKQGDYIEYVGKNGCDGEQCQGNNVNYVSDTNMGYCSSSNYKFTENGWRVGYIENDTAYLVSGGSPECYGTFVEEVSSSTSNKNLDSDYYYGSGYYLNPSTGYYELKGVTSSTLDWESSYRDIINNTPYTCFSNVKSVNGDTAGSCKTLYKVNSYVSNTTGSVYTYKMITLDKSQISVHLKNLDDVSIKYCNKDYAYGGVCDDTSSWNMDVLDFQKITGSVLSNSSCLGLSSNMNCGYNNTLIDNGSYYWISPQINSNNTDMFFWNVGIRGVDLGNLDAFGVRPVLRFQSSVYVVSGNGTYEDPYQIGND